MAQASQAPRVNDVRAGGSVQSFLEQDVEKFSRPHRLIIISAVNGSHRLREIDTCADRDPLAVLFDVMGSFQADDLAMVQGLESHGLAKVVTLAPEEERDVIQPEGAVSSTLSADLTSLIQRCLSPKHCVLPASTDRRGILVTVSTITVFTEATDADQPGTANTVKSEVVWKWAKPNSVYYSKGGAWEADLSKAIKDGAWNAGMELMICSRRVSPGEKQRISTGRFRSWIPTPIVSEYQEWQIAEDHRRALDAFVDELD